ncbi:hypothetical protein [Frankia sp. Cj5]|uniref:hypothetical protein n=1 Tax=Frankia sp. Cj5 TaxID=2880978 RepID=UPI001EF61DB1|nr:hypothetical protein [Frankia sp. Cj5]
MKFDDGGLVCFPERAADSSTTGFGKVGSVVSIWWTRCLVTPETFGDLDCSHQTLRHDQQGG